MALSILIKNARLVTLGQTASDGWLRCEAGKIASIGYGESPYYPDAEIIDAAELNLLPGFIDLHVHGAVGHEAMDATHDALQAMAQFYAKHGVTAFLATTWTDKRERIQAALEAIASVCGPQLDGATLLGAHLEGPYLNPAQCGAQNTRHIRRAKIEETEAWLELGVIRLLALAPEYPENHWLIQECVRRGIVVSAAHTTATYDQMRDAITMGLTQATHTYNAMTGLHHREPGTLGAAMTSPEIRCELIADNIHVHPAAMKLLWLAKGRDGVILISDAVRSSGMPDGDYPIDERVITVRDGVVRLEDGTLAGSSLTMDRAVYNFMQATNESLGAVWQSSSLNAALSLGIDRLKGSLAVGKDADLVLVDNEIKVYLTIAEGSIVYRNGI